MSFTCHGSSSMYVVDWRFVEGVATASGPINGKATVNNTGEFRRKTMI